MNAEHTVRKRRMPLRASIFIGFAVFTLIIMILMWLGMSVFLEGIYKSIKISEIKDAADTYISHIDKDDEAKTVDLIAEANNVCILVFSYDGFKTTQLFSNHNLDTCVIHTIDKQSYRSLYDSAKANGGRQMQRFMYDAHTNRYIGITGDFFDKAPSVKEGDYPESIIYTVIDRDRMGNERIVILNSVISPVNATLKTLNFLLVEFSIILLVIASVLAFIISRWLVRPIASLTASARELARGNYNVEFKEGGYREISELSGALNFAEEELAKTDRLRRELIANVSHDLRTPLTMIIGYSEAMKDIPGENTPENAQVIIDETKRLASLVNDMLDISKLESGVGGNHPETFNITTAVGESLGSFSRLCERYGYVIDYVTASDSYVTADERRIMQAVYNLVNNALTHIGDDKRVVVAQSVIGGRVRISVSDRGEGVPPDKLPLIWERYYKVDRVHKRAAQGSGLGLSIVRTIMELNNGSYGVVSTEGVGSTFWIELPLTEIKEDPKGNSDA